MYVQEGVDWLIGTARRNPEGLLLLAAGCALLLRSGRGASRASTREDDREYSRASTTGGGGTLSSKADTAKTYASDLKERVSDTVSEYAGAVSDFAGEAGRKVSEGSDHLRRHAQSTLENTMSRVLREQPLAVAMVGLAAGAAVAAAFPATEIENRALGGAREALGDAASKAGEAVKDAAGKAGQRLKEAAEERGLTAEGLKEMAGDVTETFTDAISGKGEGGSEKSQAHVAPSTVPDSHGSGSRSVGGVHQSEQKENVGLPGSSPVGTRRSGR
jgi:hypothetical protein